MHTPTPTELIISKINYRVKQYFLNNNDDNSIKPYKCRDCQKECLGCGCKYFVKNIISPDIIKKEYVEIEQYLADYTNNKISKPDRCKSCKNRNCLNWHCKYYRKNVITLGGKYSKFPIRCVRCKICGVVFAVIPIFLIKYYRFSKYVIKYTLNKIEKMTYEDTFEILYCIFDINVTISTLQKWTNLRF